MNDKSAAASST